MSEIKSKIEENKQPHIFVATPMYGGQCTGGFMQSVLDLQIAIKEKGWGFTFLSSMNDALIQRARNYLVHKFLETEASHLLFIDADIIFNPQDVIKMVEANEDLICGMYPKKMIIWERVAEFASQGMPAEQLPMASVQYVFNVHEDQDPNIRFGDHTVEIRHGGTGYMLIKRNVFETLQKTTAKYNNDYYWNDLGKEFYNFFSFDINGNMLLSEDWYFCESWTKQGGKIKLAAWALARHLGTFTFG